jgi:hypothetical protein
LNRFVLFVTIACPHFCQAKHSSAKDADGALEWRDVTLPMIKPGRVTLRATLADKVEEVVSNEIEVCMDSAACMLSFVSVASGLRTCLPRQFYSCGLNRDVI